MGTLIKLTLTPGTEVGYNGANYSIKRVLDLSNVLIEHLETKTLIRVEIKDLVQCYTDIEKPKVKKHTDAFHYSEKDWAIALKRLAIITPIIQNKLGTEEIKAIASKEKVHISTIYRWIERYQKTQQTSSLVRDNKTPVTKKGRLDDEVELIISTAIEDVYLTRQKKSVQKVCDEVIRRCNNAKIVPPSPATIRRRIDVMSDEHKMRHRLGYEVSRTKYDPIQGHLEAPHPLALVQIDHTRLDIILVDEIHRKPMTRPWITLAIDVFSRMVVGLYISFDPPGALATGMCIANAILPKEMWLAKNDIRGEWPCWGIMDTIHADNAKEFRGNMLKRAAEEYGINLEWRKLKQPNWGGHIERYLGTLLKEIHALPGTTFSNTQERKSYNSEKQAALTIKELEKWITTFIVNVYHNKYHSGIGTSPLAKFNEGIFGTPETKGRGIPTRIYNERKIRLDFMPYEERSVQEYGVQIDHIHYYDDKLRPYINALEPEFKKRRVRRKFIFKRDPRDISYIYFYDPELKEYFDIPYRDISHPPITIWEFNSITAWLKKQGKKHIDEKLIFEGYEKMLAIENAAIDKKRVAQRNKNSVKKNLSMEKSFRNDPASKKIQSSANSSIPETTNTTSKIFQPFDDIEL